MIARAIVGWREEGIMNDWHVSAILFEVCVYGVVDTWRREGFSLSEQFLGYESLLLNWKENCFIKEIREFLALLKIQYLVRLAHFQVFGRIQRISLRDSAILWDAKQSHSIKENKKKTVNPKIHSKDINPCIYILLLSLYSSLQPYFLSKYIHISTCA